MPTSKASAGSDGMNGQTSARAPLSAEESAAAEEKLGYTFRDKALLCTCFTHSSYAGQWGGESNERLEFLGDALLGFFVAERLYGEGGAEGEMTAARMRLVSAAPLERAVRRAGLEKFLRTAGGYTAAGKAVSSLFEALVAGVYLDGGLEAARAFVFSHLSAEDAAEPNYKGALQEYLQAAHLPRAEYTAEGRTGSDHAPRFTVRAEAAGKSAVAEGASLREAEKRAAALLLRQLRGQGE